MSKVQPRTLSGFMELLPGPQRQMEQIMAILRETYSLYGFTPLDTPVIESSEVLLAKAGGETEKQIYRFTKGDSDLSLRFDLTVPCLLYTSASWAGPATLPTDGRRAALRLSTTAWTTSMTCWRPWAAWASKVQAPMTGPETVWNPLRRG